MKFKVAGAKIPNGTVLLLGISYANPDVLDLDATRGITPPKVFTYALLKTNGLWWVTGGGKTPSAAGALAVDRWLEKDGRTVEWAKVCTPDQWRSITVSPPRVDTSQASR